MPSRPGPSRFIPPMWCSDADVCYAANKCIYETCRGDETTMTEEPREEPTERTGWIECHRPGGSCPIPEACSLGGACQHASAVVPSEHEIVEPFAQRIEPENCIYVSGCNNPDHCSKLGHCVGLIAAPPTGPYPAHQVIDSPEIDPDTFQPIEPPPPFFTIRAYDRGGPEAVLNWIKTAAAGGSSNEKLRSAFAVYLSMVEWQRAHPELVKTPD